MRFWHYAATSTVLTVGVIAKVLAVYPNYYAAMAALGSNSANLLVLANQLMIILYLIGRIVIAVFFGELRLAEIEKIYQKAWLLAIDCILLAGNLGSVGPAYDFVLLLCFMGLLLIIHWSLQERVSVFYQMLNMPTKLDFIRILSLTSILIWIDVRLCYFGWTELLNGHRMIILLTFHFVDLLQMSIGSMCRLWIDFYEVYMAPIEEDEEWELKNHLMFVVELCLESLSLVVYGLICYALGSLPFHMMFGVADKCRKIYMHVSEFYRSVLAKSQIASFVSDPCIEDIQRDNLCVICREEMELDATSERLRPRKMQCGHVIHFACLKSWLNRSQNCPTCRQAVKGARSAFTRSVASDNGEMTGVAAEITRNVIENGDVRANTPQDVPSRPTTPQTQTPATPDASWIKFPIRSTETGQQIKFGELWYDAQVL